MTDFLTRLIERTLGNGSVIQPVLPYLGADALAGNTGVDRELEQGPVVQHGFLPQPGV